MMMMLGNKEIKQFELAILKEFDMFCKQYRLRYYLAGGTLLGAIRHKGFIPWDDDIDVCMPRDDYMKFLSLRNKIPPYLKIKSNIINNFHLPFAKLVDLNIIIKSKYSNDNSNNHLWIDIFPVDGLPQSLEESRKIYEKGDFYRKILLLIDARLGEGSTVIRKYSKYLLKPLAQIYGKQRCIDKIEKIAAKYPYEESQYVGIVTWGLYGAGERMLKSEFEKVVEVEFEGHKFPAFSCWDSYLTGLYGDYMQLPPVEKRKTHNMEAYLLDE